MERAAICGQAIPVLPAADWETSVEFWRRLGFTVDGPHHGYAIARRGSCEVHLSARDALECFTNPSGCYLRVDDVTGFHTEMRRAGVRPLPAAEDKPWGMREFHMVDPTGNLIRVGQPIIGV